jgi:hypothetical protein
VLFVAVPMAYASIEVENAISGTLGQFSEDPLVKWKPNQNRLMLL